VFEDPDEPAESKNDGDRPMSLFGVVMWMMAAFCAYVFVSVFVVGLTGRMRDPVINVACQVVGYLLVLYAMLRIHGRQVSIFAFVGLRWTAWPFLALAPILGVACHHAGSWLQERIYERFPPGERLGLEDVFFGLSLPERLAITIAFILASPIVEELIFRGATFSATSDHQPPRAVVGATAIGFALVHLEPRLLGILFLMGILLGYLRWASGSLLPPMLLHIAFNATELVPWLQAERMPSTATPLPHALAAFAIVGVGVALVHLAGKRRRGF
jgi:uncharacterized protein